MTVVKRIVTELLNAPPHPYDDNPDWQRNGACWGKGPALWFPERGTHRDRILEAKRICAACPIKQKCLDYALWHGDRQGIWGGKTEKERRNIRMTQPILKPPRRKRITIEWVEDEIETVED